VHVHQCSIADIGKQLAKSRRLHVYDGLLLLQASAAVSMIPASFIKVFSPRGFTSRGVILDWERCPSPCNANARSKIEPPLATTARFYAFLPAAQQGKYTVNVDS